MRASVLLIVFVLVAGCASSSSSDRPSSPPRRPGMDMGCYNDCLGAGTSKEFCEERCSY
jgi:hypothetical protein